MRDRPVPTLLLILWLEAWVVGALVHERLKGMADESAMLLMLELCVQISITWFALGLVFDLCPSILKPVLCRTD